MPNDVQPAPQYSATPEFATGPGVHPISVGQLIGTNTGYYISGDFSQENIRDIFVSMGILFNGVYRENVLPTGVFDYLEKYARSNGSTRPGMYCYNFCLNTDPKEYQPSGAINLSKFKTVELEISTIIPIVSSRNANFRVICDGDGNPIGVNKSSWQLYDYTYNMTLFEERYNILSFISGNCGMLYAR